MIITKFKNPIFPLLLVAVYFSSCNAQTKTEQPNETVTQQRAIAGKNAKLIKTLGTTEHQNVHCSLQDENGNLWFGTTGEGVYRFDGNEFTQFTQKDGLSNNSVWSILEDESGNIWFGTDDGVSRYDGKSISKVPFALSSSGGFGISTTQSSKNPVWSIFQDKSGIIWFGTSADLYCYDGKSFSRFLERGNISNKQNLTLKWIQCFLEDSNGAIWMGSGPIAEEGAIQFDGKSITSSKPNGDGWIRSMVEDKYKRIWFGGRGRGNFIYDGKNFTEYTEKVGIGNPILADRSGNVWFTGEEKLSTVESEGGIWSYDGNTFKNYTTRDGLSNYFVWSMLEDSNGNIWIGTRNTGLCKFDGKTFTSYSE